MNKMSLTALARTHLALAEQAPNGRSAHTVHSVSVAALNPARKRRTALSLPIPM